MIYDKADIFCKTLAAQLEKGVVELRTNLLAFTTDVVCEQVFNESLDLLHDQQKAADWQSTIKALADSTPLVKQFTWILPIALKLPLGLVQVLDPKISRIVAFQMVIA